MSPWTRVVPPSRAGFGVPVRVAAAVLAAGLVAGGIWVAGAVITDDATVAMAATGGWIGLAVVLAVVVGRRWRALAVPVVGAVLVSAAGIGGGLLWTSRVDRVVVEDVLVAAAEPAPTAAATPSAPAARSRTPRPAPTPRRPVLLGSGTFRSGEHRTTGAAALLRRPSGGAVVTLTDLDTSPGPDLRVYLAVGPGGPVDGGLDLGRLRGNRGTQQYEVPAGVDLRRYGSVVIWCRAFTVAFGTAALLPPA
jgi:electron transfer DM13